MVLIEGDVMYSVEIPCMEYYNWSAYNEWDPLAICSFESYFMQRYPEVLGTNLAYRGRVFTFESIEHYHWFLLKVM